MSAAVKFKDLIDSEYLKLFEESVESIKSGKISVAEIRKMLITTEIKIDEWMEDSEFYNKVQAKTLLNWSEAILQDLNSYNDEEKWDLLGAILYFVNEDDVIHDSDPLCGLDDDYQVMKSVLDKHKIKLLE